MEHRSNVQRVPAHASGSATANSYGGWLGEWHALRHCEGREKHHRLSMTQGVPHTARSCAQRLRTADTLTCAAKKIASRRAYTLVELLMVITVVGILATIVVPAMSSGASVSLKSAGRILASDLRLAADLAIQYSTQYTVTFDVAKNQYQLTLTGPGNPPALQNPQAPPGTAAGIYIVSVGQIDGNGSDLRGVRLLAAKLKTSGQSVTNISFGLLGGTGPALTEDTEIWLTYGATTNPMYLRLTVTAMTGQVWMDQPTKYPSP